MTTWVRTRNGHAIHRSDCHIVKKAMRVSVWPWADERAYAGASIAEMDLLEALGRNWGQTWNRFCYFCCHTAWFEQKRMLSHSIDGDGKGE